MREALIVGGANGIGLTIATLLAEDERFAKIHIVDRLEIDTRYLHHKFEYKYFDLRSEEYSLFDNYTNVDTLIITAGFGRLSREYAYQPYAVEAGKYRIKIPGNSVTTVTIPVRRGGMHSSAHRILKAAAIHDEPFPARPECGADQKAEDYHYYGVIGRYARFTFKNNGRVACDSSVGKISDGMALKIFKGEDEKANKQASLVTDIQDAEIIENLKAELKKLCGVTLR
jgi:hypothetical protein